MNSSTSNIWSQLLRKHVGSLLERLVREAMAAIGLAFDSHLDVGILFQHPRDIVPYWWIFPSAIGLT